MSIENQGEAFMYSAQQKQIIRQLNWLCSDQAISELGREAQLKRSSL